MATIIVDQTDDGAVAEAAGTTLREAINTANNGDTIVFDPSLAGQIVVTASTIAVTKDITIDADLDGDEAADVQIAPFIPAFSLFTVSSGAHLTLQSTNIAAGGGTQGGAVAVDAGGSLTIDASEIGGGSVTLTGGAIWNSGTTVITNSAFSSSQALFGGGAISNLGSMQITNSSFVGNSAGDITGNQFSAGQGGAIASISGSTLTLTNVTITGNEVYDGIGLFEDGVGGGLQGGGNITLTNTIISGNTATTTPNAETGGGSVTDNGGNIIDGNVAQIFDGGTGTLADNGGAVKTVALLNSATNPALDVGARTGDAANGIAATDIPGAGNDGANFGDSGAFELLCFAAGTLISTPDGETRVETLSIGAFVKTAEGNAAPVKWIGRQTVSTRFGSADRLKPIRFAAGSLGDGVPHSDLTVTADHAMLIDGMLCNAGALVNGTTITRVPLFEMGETFTVYHIETEAHEIILANGAPAETFIDNVSRRVFDNYAEFEALYGDVPEMEELPLPRAMSVRQVPARIRESLAPARAG